MHHGDHHYCEGSVAMAGLSYLMIYYQMVHEPVSVFHGEWMVTETYMSGAPVNLIPAYVMNLFEET